MFNSFRTITAWLGRHREKLIDAGLLLLALNVSGVPAALPPPPWPAQLLMLALFAALASPRAHLIPDLWPRYGRFLPGYAAAAVAGVVLFAWWFSLPGAQLWFAPLWLAFTVLARLLYADAMGRIASHFRMRRLDILGADLVWLAIFSAAAPRWTGQPGPSPAAVASLMLGWAGWHWFREGHKPATGAVYFRRSWSVIGLALTWGLLWGVSADGWPAAIFCGWLGLALLLTRWAADRFAADAGSGSAEVLRWLGLVAFAVIQFHSLASANVRGAQDAQYYATFLADSLEQFRHGVFPVFAGQSEYQFNGAIIPIRVAPGFQYLGGLLDLLTGRMLNVPAVQNLLICLTALGAAASSYVCLRRTTGSGPLAWMLSLLFLSCPGVIGLPFISDLFMSWLTVPLVPVVLYVCCRSFAAGGAWRFAGLGFSLGLTWWLHAPIALWLTLVATGLQLLRLVWRRPPWRPLAAELAAGTGAFLTTAAYPLVSAAIYPADPTVGSSGGFAVHAANILQQLLETFPAAWLPLSANGRMLGDFQIGYGLLAISVLLLPATWRSGRIELRGLAVIAGLLLLLLVPVPGLNLFLWEHVSAAVRTVTNTWAMQRLYVVLAGCLVFLIGFAWTTARPAARLTWVLVAACCWSALESIKFVRGSRATIDRLETVPVKLLPENITLTRYSYGLFAAKPSYFTHGVNDPVLENRFLADDLRTVTGGNQAAAIRLARPADGMRSFSAGIDGLDLQPSLILRPGRHYLAELVTAIESFPPATLILKGATFQRVYGLPEYGEARSFGIGRDHVPFFALHTSANHEETVQVRLIPSDSAAIPGLNGHLQLRLLAYEPAALPVQIRSWIPYTATVRSEGPAWLETPRMYQAGYVATLNGRPVEVRRSAQGLVSVPVPAGTSEVEIRYVAPAGLLSAFWLSFASIGGGLTLLLFAGSRELIAGKTARVTPAIPHLKTSP